MTLPAEDLLEVLEGRVLRVAQGRLLAPGTQMPQPGLFALDEKDIREARETGRPPMLSVFDRDRTSVSDARSIVAPGEELFVFELVVERIRNLTAHLPPMAEPIKVLRNLLIPADKIHLPGILGHCGIAGLHRQGGLPKRHYRNIRDELCQLAELVEE